MTSTLNGQSAYDVTYTIDAKGAPVTPFGAPGGRPVVMAGDSYNFGEGLNDDRTLGAHLQKASQEGVRALNLARPGYGPHQVLRQMQLALPAEHGLNSFDWIIVSMIDDHIERTNGSYAWSLGPRYVLDGQGGVQLSRQYGDRREPPAWLTQLRNGSRLFAAMEKKIGRLLAKDEELFVRVLQAAREMAQRKFGAQMLVLYYSGGIYIHSTLCQATLTIFLRNSLAGSLATAQNCVNAASRFQRQFFGSDRAEIWLFHVSFVVLAFVRG